MRDLLIRAALGGTIVSLFALVGQTWRPRTFAGLFGAAPSVALATLTLAFARNGPGYVAIECRSMIAGGIALALYGVASAIVVRRAEMPVWLGAAACWAAWALASLGAWAILKPVVGGP